MRFLLFGQPELSRFTHLEMVTMSPQQMRSPELLDNEQTRFVAFRVFVEVCKALRQESARHNQYRICKNGRPFSEPKATQLAFVIGSLNVQFAFLS